MDKEDIKIDDWQRILFGDAPMVFMIEVFIRTIVIYFALVIALRLMGKRMTGQLAVAEMAVMITLGAIAAVPMQMADRGILLGLLVLVCALLFHQGINLWQVYSEKAERTIEGRESLLVKDGVLQMASLKANKISRQQLFAALRNEEIFNLGAVKRVYLEASGLFSVFIFEQSRPGMPTLFEMDKHTYDPSNADDEQRLVCSTCGLLAVTDVSGEPTSCTNCGSTDWIKATD